MPDPKPQKSEYQIFLDQKHEKFKTSREVIDGVVHKAVGDSIASLDRIIKGEDGEVYSVKTQNGQQIILRILRRGDDRPYERERWAIEQSIAVGVPAPEILLIDRIQDQGEWLSVCVENKIEGTPMNELEDQLSPEDKHRIIVDAGGILHKIHSVHTKGFGKLDADGQGQYSTIQEELMNGPRNRKTLLETAQNTGLSIQALNKSLAIIEEAAVKYDYAGQPRLLHWDYSTKHFLIKNGEINGVIDFEGAKGSDPIQEFARWDFYFQHDYPVSWLMEGYPDKTIFENDFQTKMHVWKLAFGLDVLYYYEQDKNQSMVEYSKQQLLKDLEFFKK